MEVGLGGHHDLGRVISEGWSQQTHGGRREASGGRRSRIKVETGPGEGRGCAGGRDVAGWPQRDTILQVYTRLHVWLG